MLYLDPSDEKKLPPICAAQTAALEADYQAHGPPWNVSPGGSLTSLASASHCAGHKHLYALVISVYLTRVSCETRHILQILPRTSSCRTPLACRSRPSKVTRPLELRTPCRCPAWGQLKCPSLHYDSNRQTLESPEIKISSHYSRSHCLTCHQWPDSHCHPDTSAHGAILPSQNIK